MPFRGTDADFVRALLALERDARTGILNVQGDGSHTLIHVHKGRAVFAKAGARSETLARILLQTGVLTPDKLDRSLEALAAKRGGSEEMRLSEVVIALGFVSPHEIHAALAELVKKRILRCFAFRRLAWSFDESAPKSDGLPRLPCALRPLILEGIRKFYDTTRVDLHLAPTAHKAIARRESAETLGASFEMTPDELAFLKAIDGTQRQETLLAACPGDPEVAAKVVLALLLTDAVEVKERSRSRARGGPRSTRSTARAARASVKPPARASQRPEPPVPAPAAPRTPSRPPPAQATPDGMALASAPAPAPVPTRTRPLDPRVEPTEPPRPRAAVPSDADSAGLANESFQKGKKHLRSNATALAGKAFRRASELCPANLEYAVYDAWVEFAECADASAREGVVRRLETLAMRALSQDRHFAFGHYVKGRMLLARGHESDAEQAFRIAVRLDAENVEAERYLRVLVRRKTAR